MGRYVAGQDVIQEDKDDENPFEDNMGDNIMSFADMDSQQMLKTGGRGKVDVPFAVV